MSPPARVTRTPPGSEPADFEQAFDAFFAAVRRARGRAAASTDAGELTLAQYQLLATFGERDRCPVGELAELGGVAPPTATRMLNSLERGGIVDRSHSEDDRRRVEVRLTGAGRRLLAAKRRRVAAKRRRIFDSLTVGERRDAARLLGRLADVMDEL